MNWVDELNRLWTPPRHRVVTMSDEWKLARRGRLTASSRARSIAGVNAERNFPKLKAKILKELESGYAWVEQQFPATEWGNRWERPALSNLELALGLELDESYEPGFMLHPARPYVGATPDLLIDTVLPGWDSSDPIVCRPTAKRKRKAVQVKCPYDRAIHEKTLLTKKISDDTYRYQIQWEGWVADADELLFCSYDPRQRRSDRQLVLIDVPVDHALREVFNRRCDQFHDFVNGKVVLARPSGIDSLAAQF